jgi:hypothetical protein
VFVQESENTVRSLIKLNATVTSRLPAGTAAKEDELIERHSACIGKTSSAWR